MNLKIKLLKKLLMPRKLQLRLNKKLLNLKINQSFSLKKWNFGAKIVQKKLKT